MDYFDDLDQDAMAAFDELHNDIPSPQLQPTRPPSSDLLAFLENVERKMSSVQGPRRAITHMDYLLKLDPPITSTILSHTGILSTQPQLLTGEGEDSTAQFCKIPSSDMTNLKIWLARNYPTFRPIFAPMNKARKDLSPNSAYPTLGLDTTLPQHRPQRKDLDLAAYWPVQDHFPVWYFFYGTLADAAFLAQLFNLPPGHVPVLLPASIQGGKIRTWGGKYKALVDYPGGKFEGWAYEVQTEGQEDALRMYETAKYEVVRVKIRMEEK